MAFTNEELMAAKGQGFIPQKDKEHFACRVVLPAGHLNKEQSSKLGEIAEKYGRGYISMTQRLGVEIPWIKHEDIENVKKELLQVGLENGGTGPRVRPIHTCKGTVCKFGLYDTDAIAKEMHERFYKKYYVEKLPGKLRLGLCGCKNSCSKPQLACIGLVGRKLNKVGVVIGGMFAGDKYIGKELEGVYEVEEALEIVERGIIFFKENAEAGERFAKMVARIGFEEVEKAMLGK